ncbi:hypothetical protein GJ496_008154 [Pomphorhynchus laevis]|nr:hypothetical protein GJ496_008154 [Pomphorhynchus laevis]
METVCSNGYQNKGLIEINGQHSYFNQQHQSIDDSISSGKLNDCYDDPGNHSKIFEYMEGYSNNQYSNCDPTSQSKTRKNNEESLTNQQSERCLEVPS